MLSAVKRYQALLSSALARYFPRTTEYLRAEREAAAKLRQPQPRAKRSRQQRQGQGDRAQEEGQRRPCPRTSTGIYSSARLKVDDSQIAAMRARVAEAVTAGLIGAPSDEQWAMILCRAPLARIFAGAGSGKSTTLLLRVVFMLCHLQIPPSSLTVISFTNASCAELRGQLLRCWPSGSSPSTKPRRASAYAPSTRPWRSRPRCCWARRTGSSSSVAAPARSRTLPPADVCPPRSNDCCATPTTGYTPAMCQPCSA
jgi:hypothetical protein